MHIYYMDQCRPTSCSSSDDGMIDGTALTTAGMILRGTTVTVLEGGWSTYSKKQQQKEITKTSRTSLLEYK